MDHAMTDNDRRMIHPAFQARLSRVATYRERRFVAVTGNTILDLAKTAASVEVLKIVLHAALKILAGGTVASTTVRAPNILLHNTGSYQR